MVAMESIDENCPNYQYMVGQILALKPLNFYILSRVVALFVEDMTERCMQNERFSENAVKVAVRVRPLSSTEIAHANENCLQIQNTRIRVVSQQDKVFDFDAVYPPESSQEDIYTQLIPPLIDRFFDEYNATVFLRMDRHARARRMY